MKRHAAFRHILLFFALFTFFSCFSVLSAAAKTGSVIDISTECEFELKRTHYTFNGSKRKPGVKGLNSAARKFLSNTKNYEISYNNNVFSSACYSYSSAVCVIKAKGNNYKGSVSLNYEIEPKELKMLKNEAKTKNSITVKFTNTGDTVYISWYEITKSGEEFVDSDHVFWGTVTEAESRITNFHTWNKVRHYKIPKLKRRTKYRVKVFHSGAGISDQYWEKTIIVKTK